MLAQLGFRHATMVTFTSGELAESDPEMAEEFGAAMTEDDLFLQD